MKKNLKWIVFSISIIIFIVLSTLVVLNNVIKLDNCVYNFISNIITHNLTSNMKYLTFLGSGVVVIGICIITLIIFKNKKYSLFMSINLILISLFQVILKNIFTRNRPVDINLIEETGYSFPSGHSLTAMAFYGFIIYLIYKSTLSKRSKSIFIVLFSTIIFIIGLSRIYLGVHFFSDVVGGFSFSLAYLIIYTNLIKNKI